MNFSTSLTLSDGFVLFSAFSLVTLGVINLVLPTLLTTTETGGIMIVLTIFVAYALRREYHEYNPP